MALNCRLQIAIKNSRLMLHLVADQSTIKIFLISCLDAKLFQPVQYFLLVN